SIPAACAAASRLMPSSALAIASMRRPTRASSSALASLRSITGVRSLRIVSAAMVRLRESLRLQNHASRLRGIAAAQHESIISCPGISPEALALRTAITDEHRDDEAGYLRLGRGSLAGWRRRLSFSAC